MSVKKGLGYGSKISKMYLKPSFDTFKDDSKKISNKN